MAKEFVQTGWSGSQAGGSPAKTGAADKRSAAKRTSLRIENLKQNVRGMKRAYRVSPASVAAQPTTGVTLYALKHFSGQSINSLI
ncbi:MAG: hypothetical protein ACKN9T_02595 [Candidatus Methylumidiphilus sp.]